MRKLLSGVICLAMSALVVLPASADRIRDLTTVQGVRDNALIGYGLVVGLDGTGDQTTQTPFMVRNLNRFFQRLLTIFFNANQPEKQGNSSPDA